MFTEEGAPFESAFQNSTPWVAEAQKYVAGDLVAQQKSAGTPIKFIDEYKTLEYVIEGEFAHAKPAIQADAHEPVNTTDVLSYSHSKYNVRTADQIDAANFYAASEVGAKLKSREAIYKYFGAEFPGPQNVSECTCQEINQYAYEWVRKNWAGDKAPIERYDSIGQPLEFIEDTKSESGITWINRDIIYTNTTEAYQVSSRKLLSPIDFEVKIAAGMLYCKLMSPARIVEWMLVDSLKEKYYWIPNVHGEDKNDD